MDSSGTVLITTEAPADWSHTIDLLGDEYGYRVLVVRSALQAATTIDHVHVDLIIADDKDGLDGCQLLADLRVSHPDTIRLLSLDAESPMTVAASAAAAVYQFIRRPLDPHLVGLVVKRGLEARELARRHRLL